MGMNINQPINISAPSRHTATITLDNSDGAFTPNIGGTYSAVNWFAQGVFIKADVNGTYEYPVFHGIIEGFDLLDDGRNSTVTLTVVDPLTFAGRSKVRTPFSSGPAETSQALLFSYIRVSEQGALPALGGKTYGFFQLILDQKPAPADPPFDRNVILNMGFSTSDVVADVISSELAPSAFCVFWPYQIRTPSFTSYSVDTISLGSDLVRRNYYSAQFPQLDAHTFTFTEKTPGTGELPIRSLNVGYNITELINQADVTTKVTGNTSTVTNQDSIDAVGIRSVQYSGTLLFNDDYANARAEELAYRFSETRFVPGRLQLSAKQVDALCDASAAQEWALLLDAGGGLWQQAFINYTPTGGVSQKTEHSMLAGRTISVTPTDTVLTLTLLPAVDYQMFVLDDSGLGVLGGSLTDYDDGSLDYDDPAIPYEGVQAAGNRLG